MFIFLLYLLKHAAKGEFCWLRSFLCRCWVIRFHSTRIMKITFTRWFNIFQATISDIQLVNKQIGPKIFEMYQCIMQLKCHVLLLLFQEDWGVRVKTLWAAYKKLREVWVGILANRKFSKSVMIGKKRIYLLIWNLN